MIHDTQSAQISQKQDERNIYIYIYSIDFELRFSIPYINNHGEEISLI